MHRMGLVDFWYYVNEEFYFKDGHMLLRGSNGSGKSVTMQSFIPLLLDGNKSSERLDSFGTRSRKIENYLLEEDGDREERIGYLYIEFKREDSDVYKTIGMGLHARKNKPLNTWYFVIEDNRRVNIDFSLIEHNLAITKQMLKNIIGSQLIESQKEYMDRVNQALFGFASRDDYKEAINLLMQLRSPKLSNSLKPTIINDILSNSLQPLSEDDLRPMSEAISNMDEIKDQLDALKLSYTAAKDIAQVYDAYNHVMLDAKATSYLQEEQAWTNIQNDILKLEQELVQCEQTQEETKEALQKLHIEQDVLHEEKSSLLQQDMLQLVDDVARHKTDCEERKLQLSNKEVQYEDKDNRRITIKNNLSNTTNKQQELFSLIQETLEDMDELQETMQFEEHTSLKQELMQELHVEYDATFAQTQIKTVLDKVNQGLQLFQKIQSIVDSEQRLSNERESYILQKEQVQKELSQYQTMFHELMEEVKEAFSKWSRQNKWLQLNDQQMLQVFQYITEFEDENSFPAIEQLIHTIYFEQYQAFAQDKIQCELTINERQKELLEVQKELELWEQQRDPQPELDEAEQRNRAYLTSKNIPFQPLYQLLDFEEAVSKTKRNHFEEMLDRSGLLNTLLVEEAYKETILQAEDGIADQYLFITKPIKELSVYMIKETITEEGAMESLFDHFHIQSSQFQAYATYYQQGALLGTISKQVESKFIGKASRERYRKEKLDSLNEKRQTIQSERNELQTQLQALTTKLTTLKTEYDTMPQPDDLQLAKDQMRKKENVLEMIHDRIHNVEEQINKIQGELQVHRKNVQELADHLNISSTKEAFDLHKESFLSYEDHLRNVLSTQKQYCSSYELCSSLQIQLQDIEQDVDTLRAELKMMQTQIEKLETMIKQKEEQLASLGYEDIKKRIDEIQTRLQELPISISKKEREDERLSSEIEQKQTIKTSLNAQLETQKGLKDLYFMRYLDEAKLYYVCDESEDIEAVDYVHRKIQKKYPNHKRKDVLSNELQTSFYAHRGALQEYNLSIFTLFEDEESARLDISARYQGVKIPFMQLLDNLQSDIDKQSILLEDSDRALIEDILVNTISKKIRVHIQNSRHWVETMNRYMNAMNTSSGLKLNLQWKSRKAETEEEMSSEKLVELLEKDVRILKDHDIKRLSTHFRSKITMARKLAEQEETHESFHQVMRKVMDYRTWFDFRILSQKTGEKKKELTNNAFYAFSGGEKAMAMYVPLFSAVAAKFESANDDAPLLIALDEAFAGVDEKNINNMFDLIKKFKFDYIMNSQVLWGDYPSVPSLAIYELFRPENAHFVTVIAYEWNGHTKKQVER